MISIGIAGTAKNTGKTTTLSAVIDELYRENPNKIALTSIGYDGEEVDNITGLLKPRYKLKEGIVLATAKEALNKSTGEFEEICETNIFTPLGRVKVVRIKKEGLFVVAGPNKGREIEEIKKVFSEMYITYTFIDGALNRIAPMEKADAIIISTGAAMDPNIEKISDNAGAISYIFNNIEKAESGLIDLLKGINQITIIKDKDLKKMSFNSLLDGENLDDIIKEIHENDLLFLPGLSVNYLLGVLIERLIEKNFSATIVFKNPINLLLSGIAEKTADIINKGKSHGINFKILKKIPLIAFTVNPYYPQYNPIENIYKEAYIDETLLKDKMIKKTNLPVVNIKKDGPGKLINLIKSLKV